MQTSTDNKSCDAAFGYLYYFGTTLQLTYMPEYNKMNELIGIGKH